MLTNREVASLILLAALGFFVLRHRQTREALPGVAAAFLAPKVFIPILGLVASTCALVVVGKEIALWEPRLVPETIAWVLVPGSSLLYGLATRKADEPYFRRTALRAFQLTGFIEVVIGFLVFGLIVELVLVGALTLLGTLWAVAESQDSFRSAKSLLEVMLSVIGFTLLLLATIHIISGWDTFDKALAARALFLPVGLTLGVMPYLYAVALWAGYDHAFIWINYKTDNPRTRWRAKLGLVLALHFRAAKANCFHGHWLHELTQAKSVVEARWVGRNFLRDQRHRVENDRDAESRLHRFTGVNGAGEDGRRLDQREFAETKKVLRLLATMQMGWFRNRGGRYRRDLLRMLHPDGLPADHGIVLTVAEDGQTWWAWRRTVTGWCFAIGAADDPPDEWLYDGPDPPRGFPGKDPAWGERWGVDAPNW